MFDGMALNPPLGWLIHAEADCCEGAFCARFCLWIAGAWQRSSWPAARPIPCLDEGSTAVRVTQSLPPPDQTGMAVDLSNYRIGPLDVFGSRCSARPS